MGVSGLGLLAPGSEVKEETKDAPPKDGKAHYVNPPANTHIWREGMTMQEVVEIAKERGLELVALCGYVWIPQHDEPYGLPVCERCSEIVADHMLDGL